MGGGNNRGIRKCKKTVIGLPDLIGPYNIHIDMYLQDETEQVDAPGGVAVEPLGHPGVPLQLPLYTLPIVTGT